MKKRLASIMLIMAIVLTCNTAYAQITQQLGYGSRGNEVIELQRSLNSLGYNTGTPDGIYGYKTYTALKSFQSSKGLNSTGYLNFTTLNRLNKAVSKEPLVLSYGMKHDRVSELQTYLYALKYLGVSPTGYYGTLTQSAVSNFQRDNGLAVTGKADVAIFNSIFKAIDKKFLPYKVYTQYTVVKGDTLWSVATNNGITLSDLLKANNITSSTYLNIGQTIKIPKTIIPIKPCYGKYGEYQDWFTSSQYIFPIGAEATVIDFFSRKSFRIKRTIGSGHADCETLTLSDTQTMKEIWGGSFSWVKRPVIIVINGRRLDAYQAGININNRSDGYGYGPNYDYIKGNGMDGHFDLHFPGSLRHKDWTLDPEHQSNLTISSNR